MFLDAHTACLSSDNRLVVVMVLFGYVGALAIHVEDGEAKLVAYNAQSVVVDILRSSSSPVNVNGGIHSS